MGSISGSSTISGSYHFNPSYDLHTSGNQLRPSWAIACSRFKRGTLYVAVGGKRIQISEFRLSSVEVLGSRLLGLRVLRFRVTGYRVLGLQGCGMFSCSTTDTGCQKRSTTHFGLEVAK